MGAVFGSSRLCVVLLPLCGGNGVVLGAALAAWMGLTGYRERRIGHVIAAATCVVLIGLYLVDWHAPPQHAWPTPTLRQILTTTSGYAGSFLQAPFGALWPLRSLLVLGWLVAATAFLVHAHRTLPAERPRILALGAFLGAEVLLTLVVGRGRAGRGWEEGLEPD